MFTHCHSPQEVCLSRRYFICCILGVLLSFSQYTNAPLPILPLSAFLASCNWYPAVNEVNFILAQSTFEGYWDSFMPRSLYSSEICKDYDIFSFRAGPFATRGGNSWNAVAASLNSSTLPSIKPNLFAVSDFVIGNTDSSGALIGYPPIHQHHFHLYGSGDDQQDMNNHGDSQCLVRSGGVSCLERKLPHGYAFIIYSHASFHTEFNDVRPTNASRILSWVVVAMKFLPFAQEIRQVTQTYFSIQPTTGISSNRGTFLLRTDLRYVSWNNISFTKYVMENILEAYAHMHYAMVAGAWLFSGTADDTFNDTRRATMAWRVLHARQVSFRSKAL